jgi:hypothetical protein
MQKYKAFFAVILGLCVSFGLLIFPCLAQEEITITTYYPSPYGSYDELQSNKMAVGDVDGDGVLTASDQPNRGGAIAFESQLGDPTTWFPGKAGELVFSSMHNSFYYYDGTNWKEFGAAGWYVPSSVKLTTATHNGNFGGYQAMHNWIQLNGCQGYHVCDSVELTRYVQMNGSPPFAQSGWFNSGLSYVTGWVGGFCSGSTDCMGWRSAGSLPGQLSQIGGPCARGIPNFLAATCNCNTNKAVVCCK